MGLRKDSNGRPEIAQVSPVAAIAGGEFQIRGKGFTKPEWPRVTIGDVVAPLTVGSDSFVIAKVPEGASSGELVISSGARASQIWACDIGIPIADSLHPVCPIRRSIHSATSSPPSADRAARRCRSRFTRST